MTGSMGRHARKLPWLDLAAMLFVIACTFAVAWHWTGLSHSRDGAPLLYVGDAEQYSYIIEQSGRPGGLSKITNAGAPFGTQHQDFPNGDWGNLALARMTASEGDFGNRFNRYYLLTFLLTAVAGFGASRYAGIGRCWSIAVAIAFTLLPFHFGRLGHLFYTNYSAGAVAFVIAIALTRPWPSSRHMRALRAAGLVAGCIWCGVTGVYYALFSCAVIGAVGTAELVRRRDWRVALHYVVAIACISIAVGVQLLPSLSLHRQIGQNQEVATRNFSESEVYGLKIAQMLLPSGLNQFKALRQVRSKYDTAAPLVNENGTASLGMLGAVGLLLSFGLLLAMGAAERLPWTIRLAGMLVVVLTAVASVGGFSSLFAMEITPLIRAWNRISPFIGFYSLIVVAGVIQHALSRRGTTAMILGATAIVVALVDQRPIRMPGISRDFAPTVTRFKSDRQFARELVARLPAHSMVLQVPYISYPEAGSPFGDYAQFRNNLNAPELWWTHGAMKGRAEGNWLGSLGNLPTPALIDAVRRVGFRAVVVDATTLAVPPLAAINEYLKTLPGVSTIRSIDGVQVAYLFPADDTLRGTARAVAPHGGWWPVAAGDSDAWSSASGQHAVIELQKTDSIEACLLVASFSSAQDRTLVLTDDTGKKLRDIDLRASTSQKVELVIPSTVNELFIDTAAPPQKAPGDDRKVSFKMSLGSGATCAFRPRDIAIRH